MTSIYVKGALPNSTLTASLVGGSVSVTETIDGPQSRLSELQIVDQPGPDTREVELPAPPEGMVYSGCGLERRESGK